MTRRVRAGLAVVTLLASVGFGGCGTAQARSAADELPSLRASLSKVDAAMASRRYVAAQTALERLIADVRRAREAGDLDEATAHDIVTAARRLLKQLEPDAPAPDATTDTPKDDPSDDTSPRPTRTPSNSLTPEPTAGSSEPTSGPSAEPTPEPTSEPAASSGSSDPASPSPATSSTAATEQPPTTSGLTGQTATPSP